MIVQLTGATGFVGSSLLKYFQARLVKCLVISMRDEDWITQIDNSATAIVHLAGKAHDTSKSSPSEEYFRINRDLTIAIFDKFIKSDIRDFFYFSSVKAAVDTAVGVVDEAVIGDPKTAYGKSKLEAEAYLLNQVLPNGKRLFIIRPCMVHGPGNKGNFNLLYKTVEKGIPWPLASFSNQRSFLSIDNLCYLLEAMIQKDNLQSGIYNFADDEVLSTNDLVILISETLGKKARLWNVPSSLITTVAKVGDILPLPLNSERLKKLTESYIVSNLKIKNSLEIEKLPTNAREGLLKTIMSFR